MLAVTRIPSPDELMASGSHSEWEEEHLKLKVRQIALMRSTWPIGCKLAGVQDQ